MKTEFAVKQAGSVKALADLLEITSSAISQWGEDVPETRIWQLRVLRPQWFEPAPEVIDRRVGPPTRRTGPSPGRRSTDKVA